MKIKINWKELGKLGKCKIENVKCKIAGAATWRICAMLHFTLCILHFTFATGCSALTPSAKTQTMSLYAIGIPGIAVVTHSTQDADNKGDDENRPTQANPVSVDVPIR